MSWTANAALCGAVALGLLGGCRKQESGSGYEIGELGSGRCLQINAAGQVLGVDENNVPFVTTTDGERTSLGIRGEASTVGLTINEAGTVFGYEDDLDRGRIPVQHDGTSWSEVPGVGELASITHAAPGDRLVGFRYLETGPRSVLLEGGEEQSLPLPDRIHTAFGASQTRVVGMFETEAGETHGYVVEEEKLVDLGTLGGPNSNALAVNEAGDVVGVAETSDGSVHAVVRYAGESKWTDLGLPEGALSTNARGVDKSSRVGGNILRSDGGETPVVFERGKDPLEVMPVDEQERPFSSAHIAAVAADGRLVGWGLPQSQNAEDSPLRCMVWTPKGGK